MGSNGLLCGDHSSLACFLVTLRTGRALLQHEGNLPGLADREGFAAW
jgi:hypothetical protein